VGGMVEDAADEDRLIRLVNFRTQWVTCTYVIIMVFFHPYSRYEPQHNTTCFYSRPIHAFIKRLFFFFLLYYKPNKCENILR